MEGISIGSRFYCCFRCRNILAAHDDIVDKCFVAENKRAFLFSDVVNTLEGAKEDTTFITGVHMVAEVSCQECRQRLGWKYEKAYDEHNKFKEGKTVLMKSRIASCAPDPVFY